MKSKIMLVSVAILALFAGFWVASLQNSNDQAKANELAEARKKFSPIQGVVITPPRNIVAPALVKDNGEVFSDNDLQGVWHLLFFGYTNCPDICPVTMGVTAQAKKLAAANNQTFPQVIFISVDPERDKVEMLTDYVQYFDPDFIGVTGDSELIKALSLQMSVVYMKMPSESDETDYLVDHSSALLLINPQGKLVAMLNPPHDAKTILKDIQTVINLDNTSD